MRWQGAGQRTAGDGYSAAYPDPNSPSHPDPPQGVSVCTALKKLESRRGKQEREGGGHSALQPCNPPHPGAQHTHPLPPSGPNCCVPICV